MDVKNIIKTFFITFWVISFYSHLLAAANDPAFFEPMDSVPSPGLFKRLHFTSYFHLRYSIIDNDPDNKTSEDHWSLRRFKLIADWKLTKTLQFYSQFIYKTNNYSGTDDRVYIQHAFIKLLFFKSLNFKIGQFKPPFGWERFQPDFIIPVVERSQATNRLIPNGSLGQSFVRDYGMQCFGKLSSLFQYEFAVMAGSGAHTNLSDKNAPLLVGRLGFNKKIKDPLFKKSVQLSLQLAHSRRRDTDNDFTRQLPGGDKNIFRHFSGRDNRFDYAITVNTGSGQFAAEYLSAQFLPDDKGSARIRADGWFLEHSCFLMDNWQYAIKYEHFDPDRDKNNKHDLAWFAVGLNYYFNKNHGRLMLNYIIKNEATDELKNNMVVIQLQYFLFGRK